MSKSHSVHKIIIHHVSNVHQVIALLTEVYRLDLADRALHDELLDLAGAGGVPVVEGDTATTDDTCQSAAGMARAAGAPMVLVQGSYRRDWPVRSMQSMMSWHFFSSTVMGFSVSNRTKRRQIAFFFWGKCELARFSHR